MNKVYLAGPFFSNQQRERTKAVKEALLKNPTINSNGIFVPEEHPYADEEFGSLPWQVDVFKLDVNHIYQADIMVAISDYKMEESKHNEMDSGTAFEVGLAYGCNTPVAVVQFDPEKELNLMISQGLTAYFDASKDGLKQLATYDFNTLMPKRADRPVI